MPHFAALGNTVSPSLPSIMSQFLHGRAEERRVFQEEEYKRRGGAVQRAQDVVWRGEAV